MHKESCLDYDKYIVKTKTSDIAEQMYRYILKNFKYCSQYCTCIYIARILHRLEMVVITIINIDSSAAAILIKPELYINWICFLYVRQKIESVTCKIDSGFDWVFLH